MKRPVKSKDGFYHVNGKKYEKLIGSRAQVYHGTAYKTSGGLKKDNIMMNKHGRIVSCAKHRTAKREKRLLKYGYSTRKGKFGYVKIGKTRKGRKSKRGGHMPLTPADYTGSYMLKGVVPQHFTPEDRALVGGTTKPSLTPREFDAFNDSPLQRSLLAGGSRRRSRSRSRSRAMRRARTMSRSRSASRGLARYGGRRHRRRRGGVGVLPAQGTTMD